MKIFYFVTKGNEGGAQKYVYDLATHFSENNDVTVVHGEGQHLPNKLRGKNIRTIKIKSLQRDISFSNDKDTFFEIREILKKEKPDLIHLNSPKASFLSAFAARLSGTKKIIMTVHGWPFSEERGIIWRFVMYLASHFTAILCTHTIVISNADYKIAKHMPGIIYKLSLIYNGTSTKKVLSSKEDSRTFLYPKEKSLEKIWIGSVGELNKNKGFRYAIEAIEKCSNKNFFYIIIGEGEERRNLEKKIREKNLTDKVLLLGHTKEPSQYIKAFDIFLIPSLKEGLPYVLLEAGLASLPVIASNIGGIPDVIENKKSGLLVPSKNIPVLTNTLKMLVDNKKLQNSLGDELYKRTSNKFSKKRMLRKVEKIYFSN